MTQTQPPSPNSAKKTRTIIWILLAAVVLAGLAWYGIAAAGTPPAPAPLPAAEGELVRDDSHRLTSPSTEKAQLVEFLDFECEACRAVVPVVDELKKEFGADITFIHRYFPLPGHRNSRTAALAVEAAAQQGKLPANAQQAV